MANRENLSTVAWNPIGKVDIKHAIYLPSNEDKNLFIKKKINCFQIHLSIRNILPVYANICQPNIFLVNAHYWVNACYQSSTSLLNFPATTIFTLQWNRWSIWYIYNALLKTCTFTHFLIKLNCKKRKIEKDDETEFNQY